MTYKFRPDWDDWMFDNAHDLQQDFLLEQGLRLEDPADIEDYIDDNYGTYEDFCYQKYEEHQQNYEPMKYGDIL